MLAQSVTGLPNGAGRLSHVKELYPDIMLYCAVWAGEPGRDCSRDRGQD